MTGANPQHAPAMIRNSGFPGNSQLMRREAIHICHTCPVMMQCRKYAETNIDFLTGLKSRDSCCRSDVSFLMEEIPTGIAGV